MDSDKLQFTKTSLSKSENFKEDPLIRFVILWLGFNALYDSGEGHEAEKVSRYFKANNDLILDFLKNKKIELQNIAKFVDQTHQHSRLSGFLQTRKSFLNPHQENNSVDDFSQFIYKIRNNMFHSEKSWNQEDEEKLLEMINPVFMNMISRLLKRIDSAQQEV